MKSTHPSRSKDIDQLEEYLRELVHPRKKELQALRKLILGADPAVSEGFKWNSLSFRTQDWFATINVTGTGLRLVLHRGAKPKAGAQHGPKIADPAGLLVWPAKDRCLVSISSAKDLREKRVALQSILRQWIEQL